MGASLLQEFWVATNLVLIGRCICIALATAVCVCWIIRRRCRVPYPPGPRGLPIVGHLHMLGSLPHRTLAHLSNSYGPLLSLRFGSLPAVVASSPAMAKLILQTHDKIFSGRPLNFTIPRNVTGGCPDIAFCLPGPYWKLMRQLCFTEFFSAKRLNYFKPLRAQELRSLMLSIFDAEGTPLSIREKLLRTNMNLISRMALGKSLQEIAAEIPNSEKIMEKLMELFDLLGLFNVSDYIPWLAWMDLQGFDRKSKKAARITSSVFQELIDRRRSSRSSDERPRDFLDVLLQAASLNAKNPQLQIGDDNIRAVIIDMFTAGTDTTTVTIEWALTELLINPQKLKTLQEEIDQIVGCSRLVQENDLPNLPYLRAVVNETMRLHPTAPLLAPHMSLESSQIFGYQIPKNTLVYVNAWAINSDPNIWDNPLEFSPERFLDSNTDALAQQCKFLPFGIGRRMCPGAALALLSVQSVLANLVHAFDWRTLAKPSLTEKFGLVVAMEEPLVIVPMPKLPKDLLSKE